MILSELPLDEREERARLIDYMLEFSPLKLPGSYIRDLQSVSQEDLEELYSALERPRTLVSFFKAAHLVRNNYDEWKNFLEDPAQPLPPVFLGFSENKVLFLHIFLLESMKIFNLDPHYPFFVCINVDNTNFITLYDENYVSRRIRSIAFSRKLVDMWNSFGCPEKETTDVGLMLTLLEESLERSNESEMLNGSFSLNVVLCVSLNGSILSSVIRQIGGGRLRLHMPHLVGMITLAIAFDDPEADTLEIFCELFPQFPELVSRVTSSYYLAISDPICPHVWQYYQWEKIHLKLARKVLQEEFNCVVNYGNVKDDVPLRNQCILKAIKAHPEVYVWWAAHPKLSQLYVEIVGDNKIHA